MDATARLTVDLSRPPNARRSEESEDFPDTNGKAQPYLAIDLNHTMTSALLEDLYVATKQAKSAEAQNTTL
ncbi:hypothetical protein Q1695_013106 [Nippostrongylus brasiliensis]|nr:hypothetical protein Q1695_013106 [Nippostrongylus brasiliensis]